jgi:hypothetical protein
MGQQENRTEEVIAQIANLVRNLITPERRDRSNTPPGRERRGQMTPKSLLSSIDAVVDGGKAVISGDDSIIISMVQEALKNGRSVTFYVSRPQARAVRRWFWIPRRIDEIGMELVSQEEKARIESELQVPDMGEFFSNRIQCPCGGVYGAYEFVQQGLREHGRDWLGVVLGFENTSVIRVNPPIDAICPNCNQLLMRGHYYWMGRDYGCCSGEI